MAKQTLHLGDTHAVDDAITAFLKDEGGSATIDDVRASVVGTEPATEHDFEVDWIAHAISESRRLAMVDENTVALVA